VASGFQYRRRVQFAETDLAGIVHFSVYFRYMEEAEHALWRAAGLTIARAGEDTGWPRVAAAFEYQSPLRFEDEFDVAVGIAALTRVTIQYGFTMTRAETTVGTGTLTAACVNTRAGGMKAIALPPDVVARLRAACEP
jgi:YbgC/YbaW family acyl-CoA thioester hydrolase